jgi:hypothetical protein
LPQFSLNVLSKLTEISLNVHSMKTPLDMPTFLVSFRITASELYLKAEY